MSQHITPKGMFFTVGAMGCLSVLDTTNKLVLLGVPLLMALWSRYMIQAMAMSYLIYAQEGTKLFHTNALGLHLIRGLLLLACSYLGFLSLQSVPVAEFTAITMLTPLLVTALARIFFKERVSFWRWSSVLGGLLGAVLIVRPGGDIEPAQALYPLTMALTYASFQILTSHMAKTEHPMKMHLYTGWVGALVATCCVFSAWDTGFDAHYWGLMLLVGVAGTTGHYLLILAYQCTAASLITPYLYSSIAFATLLGWVVFHHIPDPLACLGIGLIVLCGLASAWIQQHPASQPTPAPTQ